MNRPHGSFAACATLFLFLPHSAPRAFAAEPKITPPAVEHRVDAVYPDAALAGRREGVSLLKVTINERGAVDDVKVVLSGGADFDASAVTAVRAWRFRPATRDGKPVASRIRIPFRFNLPKIEPAKPEPKPEPKPQPKPQPATKPEPAASANEPRSTDEPDEEEVPGDKILDVTVHGRKKAPPTAISDFDLGRDVLTVAPAQTAADLLLRAPGVYVSRPEGDAVAHEIYLRGFNAEHGQDIELSVGGVPINQLSHIHGQGYADLNFIIPELVRSVRVTEGVYDPRQGDFAVAGSIRFDLGVDQRGYQLRTSFGSFNTQRQLVLWAPPGESEETFAAASIRKSDGFGHNRGSLSGGGIAQYGFNFGGFRGLVHFAAFGARGNFAGALRRADVAAGRVGFYASYDEPTANAQSAFSTRAQAAFTMERATERGARTELGIWLLLADYRSRQNFTGYLERSQQRPEWVGRGDLLEQFNKDFGIGARASHRTERFRPAHWLAGNFELGFTLRTHFIDQALNLLQQPLNETWDKRIDAAIHASDLGLYADADWKLGNYVHLRGGVRADVLYFDVDDRLGNFTPSFMRETHLPGFRRTAIGVSIGPRASVEVNPLDWLQLVGSYGEGYRSPNARQLEEGENAPFAKVRSFEVGARVKPFKGALEVKVAAYATWLSNDVAFSPEEGSLEKVGPTTRRGVMAQVIAKPWPFLFASASLTYVHATLDEPPSATAENPVPSFKAGQVLPYVPPIVVRADIGVAGELVKLGSGTLTGRAGIGLSHLSARPLPYSRFADPVTLVDFSGSLRWKFVELGVEIFNLFDARYAATEYSFVSDWRTQPLPSLVPARHFSAGPPFTAMANVAFHF